MGLAHHAMLGLPDGRLTCDAASREAVVRELRSLRPSVVLAPYWEDRHPDRIAASRIVQEGVFLAGLARLDTGQEPHRPGEIGYFMASWEFEPSFVVDISEHFAQKQAVLRCYASQVHNPGCGTAEPGTLISSEHYWERLTARAAHYGRLIGKGYGEPFRIRGLVEIPDLLAAFGGRTYRDDFPGSFPATSVPSHRDTAPKSTTFVYPRSTRILRAAALRLPDRQ
jgi:hypothetical protein